MDLRYYLQFDTRFGACVIMTTQSNVLPLRDRFYYASDQRKGVRYPAAHYDRQLTPLRHPLASLQPTHEIDVVL
jgi:hypothetical protein